MNVDVIYRLPPPKRQRFADHRNNSRRVQRHADPVGARHVESLSRPGGNMTGLSMLLTDLTAKELEILQGGPAALGPNSSYLHVHRTLAHPGLAAVEAAARRLACR